VWKRLMAAERTKWLPEAGRVAAALARLWEWPPWRSAIACRRDLAGGSRYLSGRLAKRTAFTSTLLVGAAMANVPLVDRSLARSSEKTR
jgi:hypothetical protein